MNEEELKNRPPDLKEITDANISIGTGEEGANLVGEIIDEKYEVLSEIGQGGLGIVYKARHLIADRLVAIKILLPGKHLDKKTIARFQREAKTAMGLKHPNIAGVQDIGIHNQMPFIVMEYVEGDPLKSYIENNSLTDSQKLDILKQSCLALEYAHKDGVVHRDIKPANIMVRTKSDGSLNVKVIDFGIAKLVDTKEEVTLTNTGDLFGTPAYMSPEQCMGEVSDNRTDIYALGCIAHELFTGASPYPSLSTLAVLNAHVNEDIPSFKAPEQLKGIDLVARKALAKNKEHRYQSAKEMIEEIEKVETGDKIHYVARESKEKRAKKIFRFLIISATLVLVGLLAFLQIFKADTIESLSERIRSNPKDVESLIDRGRLYAEQNQYRYAISDFNKVIAIAPGESIAYIRKGAAERMLNMEDRALEDINKGIELYPRGYRGYLERAILFQNQNKNEAAIADYQKADELIPLNMGNNKSVINTNMAILLYGEGQYEKSIEAADRAIELRYPFLNPYLTKAKALLALNRDKEALQILDFVIVRDPKSLEGYWLRAQTRTNLGQLEDAISDYTEYLSIQPDKIEALTLRGSLYKRTNRPNEAKADLERAATLEQKAVSSAPAIESPKTVQPAASPKPNAAPGSDTKGASRALQGNIGSN